MEIFLIIIGFIWLVGFIRQWAVHDSNMAKGGLTYENQSVKIITPIVLFLAWPYFFFYEKSI